MAVMFIGAGGLVMLFAALPLAAAVVMVWLVIDDQFSPVVLEERLRVTTAGLEHVEVHTRGERVSRLPWEGLISVRLDDAGEQVLARTATGETSIAHLGSREQRVAIAGALRERLRRTGAQIPPALPSGWREAGHTHLRGVRERTASQPGTVVHRGPRRVAATTLKGLVVAVLVALAVPAILASSASRWHLDPTGFYLIACVVLGGGWSVYQVLWARNRAPALILGPGRLAYGVLDPRTGTWCKPPEPVVGLELSGTPGDGDTAASYRLTAVLSSGRHETVDQRDGDSALREVATWLAETTGIHLEDTVKLGR